nr:CBS domain-containing protein [Anaerolineae bacterium]
MDVIVTHDNADFDAIAAQLAAHKLMPEALPLLSNRLNRNVRHFITLYLDALPYITTKELPKTEIDRLIVVDTQTIQTIRGANDNTDIHIIDHHDPREAPDPSWHIALENTGATTTILVEQVREQQIPLSPIEATTMLLGIYEDTGALTYRSTTPRDAYASAWLLERGALLDVVQEFLHYDLGDDQLALFEALQENARTYTIEGHPVVIATASAPDLVEEIATLAHRLRDLLDPEAVFLLVDLGHHIQMVARSTSDSLDVGQITEQFGGGGHNRAAAAIIRDITLAEAKERLLRILTDSLQPALTVADLMSQGVQTLSPETRARDAAKQMQKYGHEGFPVVEDNQVIGLLTRRAVDRAIGHGLDGVRINQIMEAGSVSVRPSDSIHVLQDAMMQSGWGQIPVIDQNSTILGVVTRTDLIKQMGHTKPLQPMPDIVSEILDKHLPPVLTALIREMGRVAHDWGYALYMVGGGVRDLLLKQQTTDIDIVVEGDAVTLAQALSARFGGETRTHAQFSTGKWLLSDAVWQCIAEELEISPANIASSNLPEHIDFATSRTEFYDAPTVLPEVERSSIKLDLHRRDFTINSLAFRLDPDNFGRLLDFYSGMADLKAGSIRVLHSLSFVDDPTRILRAARFEQRLGFTIEPRTAELIADAIPLLNRVSSERIKHELESILAEQYPERVFCRLDQLGALQAIHPELTCREWVFSAFRALRYAVHHPVWSGIPDDFDPELPYFALLTLNLSLPALHELCRRIRVRQTTVDMLDCVHNLYNQLDALEHPLRPSELDAFFNRASDETLLTLWAAAANAMIRDQIVEYASRLRHISPIATGNRLKELGLQPGPVFGAILKLLRAAWLDGEITSTREEEKLLQEIVSKHLHPEESS